MNAAARVPAPPSAPPSAAPPAVPPRLPAPSPRIVKTEAVVLRVHPFSRTSHVVVWLTEEGRRVATAIKGAQRPKSPFLGQYDLYCSCELLYYGRARDGLHAARECTALDRRDALRDNWRAAFCASWFAALADAVSDSGMALPGLYRLLVETLDVLAAVPGAPSPALFARYEAKLLAEAGLRPNFSAAASARPRALRFALFDGRAVAPDEAPGADSGPVVRLPADAAALYDELADSPSVGPSSSFARSAPPATAALLRFLGLFLHSHLPDAPLRGRATALSALSETSARIAGF